MNRYIRLFYFSILMLCGSNYLLAEVECQNLIKEDKVLFLPQAISNKDYIFCIDSGGTHTSLVILNKDGKILPLSKKGTRSFSAHSSGANINFVGARGVSKVVRDLLGDLL